MALIKCPECGRQISDRAPACPGCGIAKKDIQELAGIDKIQPVSRNMGAGVVSDILSHPTIAIASVNDRKQYELSIESRYEVKCDQCGIKYDIRRYKSCPLCELKGRMSDEPAEIRETYVQKPHNIAISPAYMTGEDTYEMTRDNDTYRNSFSYESNRLIEFGEVDGQAMNWSILARDKDKVLLIAHEGIDGRAYNDKWENTTWENSSLREYLNNVFAVCCFNEQEQARICETMIKTKATLRRDASQVVETRDKVFLLSIEEARTLFNSDAERICRATEYAIKQGANIGLTDASWWWLRSNGNSWDNSNAAYVDDRGRISESGHFVGIRSGLVRPAMWVRLD